MNTQFFAFFVSAVWMSMGIAFLLRAPAVRAALRRFRRASIAFQTATIAVLVVVVAVGGNKDGGGQRNVGGFTDEMPTNRDVGDSPSAVESLCFTDFSVSSNFVFFATAWPGGETIPDSVLDLYAAPALEGPWEVATSVSAVSSPVAFSHSVSTNESAGFFRLGTRLDSDGDGLPDAFEHLVSGTAADNPDTDFDGLDDVGEQSAGTHPSLADTDNDGLSDFEESLAGTDPLCPTAAQVATIRHYRDADSHLMASFTTASPSMSATGWTVSGNPSHASASN